MWHIKPYTEHHYTPYGDLSSFNRIKRSSLVRPDDTVESVEGHGDNKERAGGGRHEDKGVVHRTEPELVGRHVNVVHHVQVCCESFKNIAIRCSHNVKYV